LCSLEARLAGPSALLIVAHANHQLTESLTFQLYFVAVLKRGQAAIEFAVEKLSTISDVDGRFMMITMLPAGQMLALRVATLAGQTHSKYIRLHGQAQAQCMPAHLDAVLADCSCEGERVWRSNFSLRLTA
jgi:hypothetical protein